jgi:hypothetical protein
MIIRARSPFHIKQQNLVPAVELPELLCEDIDIAGFEIDTEGTITQGTAKIREDQTALTIASISPASFSRADVTQNRTIFVNITIPSGYQNAGGTLNCSTSVTQEAPAVVLQCKTMRVINNSTTETLTVTYKACGNIDSTQVVATQDSEDICVQPDTTINYYSGSLNWQEKFISYGCITGVRAYGIVGYVGPYLTRTDARTARNQSDWIINSRGTLAWIDDFTIQDTFGMRNGTAVSAGAAVDTDSDSFADTLKAPLLADGWYAFNTTTQFGNGQALECEIRTVDSIVQEGGWTYSGGVIT